LPPTQRLPHLDEGPQVRLTARAVLQMRQGGIDVRLEDITDSNEFVWLKAVSHTSASAAS
jgi:hypothetical protein